MNLGSVTLLLMGAALFIAACGGGVGVETRESDGVLTSPTTEQGSSGEIPASSDVSTQRLSAGEFRLPAANAFGEPGFHEVLTVIENISLELNQVGGSKLVLKLWDSGRPEETCSSQHPLSGCATVDWSDAVGRPKVPSGGVFDNRLTLQLTSGEETFYLSESGALNSKPDAFKPG